MHTNATPIYTQLQTEYWAYAESRHEFFAELGEATYPKDKALAEAYFDNAESWIQTKYYLDTVGAECIECGEYAELHEHPFA